MTNGEIKFSKKVISLEDDFACWYDIPVGKRHKYSDFIILHPSMGLLLLEVKDWKQNTIKQVDPDKFTIEANGRLITTDNPLQQVRKCTYALIDMLKNDDYLIGKKGKGKGKLIIPWAFGVVFTNLTRKQFHTMEINHVIDDQLVMCKEDISSNVDTMEFFDRLKKFFKHSFPFIMTLPQLKRIRWHIFPEIRIVQPTSFEDSSLEEKDETKIPDVINIFDLKQEKLARSLGDGHRVIHGVSGSGKTLILGYRCQQLAQVSKKPILVLCFNITLAVKLGHIISEKGIGNKVKVIHFHDWCKEQLRAYNINVPQYGNNYLEELINLVIDSVENNHIPRGQYDAVLLDEGHDFKEDWLKIIVQMVDPTNNSLLVLYDDAQSIYNRKGKLDFSLSGVGIQARGRTQILKVNYRNPKEVLDFAHGFLKEFVQPTTITDESIPIIEPVSAKSKNKDLIPKIYKKKNFQDEAKYLVDSLKGMKIKFNLLWSDMVGIYTLNWMGVEISQFLKEKDIPFQLLNDKKSKLNFKPNEDSIKLMSMHSSKGLEFPVVGIVGLGHIPHKNESVDIQAKTLYMAMTRSLDKLFMTYSEESKFTEILTK